MVLKSFLLGNPVSLCMKIINSVVVVGLYYGFLTTFSIGPSYLFLLRAWAREEQEGTEKLVSATSGFIMGQLMMFISIYYAPLHLALDRPHTITVLVLPYLLFHFLWEEEIRFFEYTNRDRNSIRNFSVRRVFLNNLIFQLVNQFLLPSSTLARLVNVYMFRCNNKMLFVTSSFVGWLIGHIFFMKWVRLVLFWIREMNSIWIREMNSIRIQEMNSIRIRKMKSIRPTNKYILLCKYYVSGLFLKSKDQLFIIILLITNIYYLGRIPLPAFTRRVPESLELRKWMKMKQVDKNYVFWFDECIVNLLFDYKQWNRPLRYTKNENFEKPVIDEMSQYFFRICPGYGKQIMSLTCPPSLPTFWKTIQRKIKYSSRFINKRKRKRPRGRGLYRNLVSINREKRNNMLRELVARIEALSKGALVLDVLEKRTRLCEYDDENKQKYFSEECDPFLSGPYRQKTEPEGYLEETATSRTISVLIVDFPELVGYQHDRTLANKVINPNTKVVFSNLFISDDPFGIVNNQQCLNRLRELAKFREIGRETIITNVPRWSHGLGIDFQEEETELVYEPVEHYPLLLRPYDRLIVYREDDQEEKTETKSTIDLNGEVVDDRNDKEIALLEYTKEEPDLERGLIRGSTAIQIRKAAFLSPYQLTVRSPLFLGRTERMLFTSFNISNIISNIKRIKNVFSFWVKKGPKFKVSTSDSEIKKDKEPTETRYLSGNENYEVEELPEEVEELVEAAAAAAATERIKKMFDDMLAEGSWETVLMMQGSRGIALLAQSIFRKYILLPSIVIAKNLVRMLFCRTSEWSADWSDWRREIHIKCTFTGVPLSDTEFPIDWFLQGIQIKVLSPFYPKPWRGSKRRSRHRDPMKEKKRNADWENKRKRKQKYESSFFLTTGGGAVSRPMGPSLKKQGFFTPIWKELKKRIRKDKKKPFLVLIKDLTRPLKKRFPFLRRTILGILKDKTRWIQKQNYIRILPARRNRGGVGVSKRKVLRFKNRYNNRTALRDNPPATATNLTHSQIQMREMYIKRRRIGGEIQKLQEELLDLWITPDGNISEAGLDAEKWEIWLFIWDILSGIGARLKHKLRLIIERIYMDIFLCTINISRIGLILVCFCLFLLGMFFA